MGSFYLGNNGYKQNIRDIICRLPSDSARRVVKVFYGSALIWTNNSDATTWSTWDTAILYGDLNMALRDWFTADDNGVYPANSNWINFYAKVVGTEDEGDIFCNIYIMSSASFDTNYWNHIYGTASLQEDRTLELGIEDLTPQLKLMDNSIVIHFVYDSSLNEYSATGYDHT